MKNICLVIGWQRPEFLELCCEQIKKADGADKLFYLFCLDEGYDSYNFEIIKKFPFEKQTGLTSKTNYRLGKQSYHVINAMLNGSKFSGSLVYYVEEDIFIGKDFFTFHQEVHSQQSDIFCSIGTKCNNTEWITTDDVNAYYLSNNPDYQSWGCCWKKEMIEKYIQPHFKQKYFTNPDEYCKRLYPHSIVGNRFTEQDGLIRRIKEHEGKDTVIAYPHVPRAYHAGVYGYNRVQVRKNTHQERVEFLKSVCFSKEQMKAHCLPGYDKDSVPVDLNINFTDLKLIPCQKKNHS